MADVLVTWFRWILAGIAAVKVVDAWISVDPATAVAWFAASALLVRYERVGAGLVAVLGLGGASIGQPSMGSHAVLIGSVGLLVAVFGDEWSRWHLIRLQVTVVYLFAGLSKVVSGFLSGDVIALRQPWLPAPQVLAVGAVVVEVWLALAVWRRWRAAVPVAAVLHVGIVAAWTINHLQFLELLAFNGLTLAMVVLVVTRSPAGPEAPGDVGGEVAAVGGGAAAPADPREALPARQR